MHQIVILVSNLSLASKSVARHEKDDCEQTARNGRVQNIGELGNDDEITHICRLNEGTGEDNASGGLGEATPGRDYGHGDEGTTTITSM